MNARMISWATDRPTLAGRPPWRVALLVSGIVSSLLYVAMNVFVASQWPSYSSASQTVSELSAVDAPTRGVWVPLGHLYTLLVAAFGLGIWLSAGSSSKLRAVGVLVATYGFTGLIWPFVPMHQRQVLAAGGGTWTDTMHLVLSTVTVLLMTTAIAVGAAALGKWFARYSVLTLVALVVFGGLTGLDAPRVSANLPTPWIGVWERINIAVFLAWIVVLACALLRAGKTGGSRKWRPLDTAEGPVRGISGLPTRSLVDTSQPAPAPPPPREHAWE